MESSRAASEGSFNSGFVAGLSDNAADRKRFRRGLTTRSELGPSSIEETLSWPQMIVDVLQQNPRLSERFFKHVGKSPVQVVTQFSGMGGPEMGLGLLEKAIHAQGTSHAGSRIFRMVSAEDHKALCQSVLCSSLDVSCRPEHVFGDIMAKLPENIRRMIELATPAKNMSDEDSQACFEAVVEVFDSVEYNDDMRSHCMIHNADCLVFARSDGDDDAVTVLWAGPPCVDESIMGCRSGHLGPMSSLVVAFCKEVRQRRCKLVFHECTSEFSPDILVHLLGDVYQVHCSFICGPEDFGWWANRPRRFTILVLRSAGCIIEDISQFKELLWRARSPDCKRGAMFFCAPDSVVRTMKYEMAPMMFTGDDEQEPSCVQCLAGGNLERLRQYSQMRRETFLVSMMSVASDKGCSDINEFFGGAEKLERVVNDHLANECCLASITQCPGQRGSKLDQSFGTLLTASLVWSWTHQRVNCGQEALQYQGVPILASELKLPFGSPMSVEGISHSQQRFLAGNAINSCIAAALTTWAISNFSFHSEAVVDV